MSILVKDAKGCDIVVKILNLTAITNFLMPDFGGKEHVLILQLSMSKINDYVSIFLLVKSLHFMTENVAHR